MRHNAKRQKKAPPPPGFERLSSKAGAAPCRPKAPEPRPPKAEAEEAQLGGVAVDESELQKLPECPYTFSDSPAYLRQKKAWLMPPGLQPGPQRCAQAEDEAKRAVELEGKEGRIGAPGQCMAVLPFTKGSKGNSDVLVGAGRDSRILKELAWCVLRLRWDEAFQVLEKRTAVPSGSSSNLWDLIILICDFCAELLMSLELLDRGLFLVTRALLRWKHAAQLIATSQSSAIDVLAKPNAAPFVLGISFPNV
eukprot:Skav200314  [mRNA]  locus=scaffold414:108503:112402:- [translate_table: standard]